MEERDKEINEMKKYELTKESMVIQGRELFRIKALVSFGNVKEGEMGGYIEKEANLSQDGNSWVYGNALVYGNARVEEFAMVCGKAIVKENAKVYGKARVDEEAVVGGNATVGGNAVVGEDVRIREALSMKFFSFRLKLKKMIKTILKNKKSR